MQRTRGHAVPETARRKDFRASMPALTNRYDAPFPEKLQGAGKAARGVARTASRHDKA